MEVKPFQVTGNVVEYFDGVSSNGTENEIKNFNPYTPAETEQVVNNTHPRRKLYKVGESVIVELEMVVKDAEGTPFPPQAIER